MSAQFWPNAHALVTGGGSGIGAATALALAQAGVRVSIAGRRMDALKQTAASFGDRAASVVAIDVTDEAAVTTGIAQIEAEAGPIDILVNNAGKAASAPFEKTDAALAAFFLLASGRRRDLAIGGAVKERQLTLPPSMRPRSV